RSFFIEQAAAARTRIECGGSTDHLAAIVRIEPFHGSVVDSEIVPPREARGDDALPKLQRLRRANRNGGQVEPGDADETKVVHRAARLDGGRPARGAVRDLDSSRFA